MGAQGWLASRDEGSLTLAALAKECRGGAIFSRFQGRGRGSSEAVLLELVVELGNGRVVHAAGTGGDLLALELVELLGLGLSLLLEFLDERLLGPSHRGGQVAQYAVLAVRLEADDLEGLGHNQALLVVVREGNTVEDAEAAEGGFTLGGLAGHHTTDSSEEHPAGGLVVLVTSAGVRIDSFVDYFVSVQSVSEERARDVHFVAADDSDTLATQHLLGHDAGETAQQVTTTINHNFLFEHA